MTVALLFRSPTARAHRRGVHHVRAASSTAACTAGRRPRSCSTHRVSRRRSSRPSEPEPDGKTGRAAAALATAAIGSFVAGDHRHHGLIGGVRAGRSRGSRSLDAPSYVALTVVALVMVSAVLGTCGGCAAPSPAARAAIGLVGIDWLTDRAAALHARAARARPTASTS